MGKDYFDKHVKVNNPHKKGIYYASITWKGYDYFESAISVETAKWLLFDNVGNR